MLMALPSISARLHPPHKSTHGIFSLLRTDAESGAVAVASLGGSLSARGPLPPSWEKGVSFSAAASPAAASPAPSSTALPALVPPTALSAREWPDSPTPSDGKPWSPKTKARRDRRVKQAYDEVEIRRALRSLWPGDWNAAEFCERRARSAGEGNFCVVRALFEMVAKTSKDALDARSYRLPSKEEVQLPHRVQESWFAFQSSAAAQPEDEVSPPVICAATGPLEVLSALRSKHATNPMVMSFELTDFAADGSIMCLDSRSAAQRDIMARTNLQHHIQQAQVEVKSGQNTTEEHLRASTDPYIVVAHNVRVFRGSVETGYPFMSLEESSCVTMLLSGRHSLRPEISKKGEYFTAEKDVLACMDRLHLFGLAGVAAAETYAGPPAATGAGPRAKPVLILSMHDLTASAAQQPRNSIAAALKSWRKLYAHMFEAVIVACGDAQTAEILDGNVNSELYASVLSGTWKPNGWHWDTSFLELSATGMLSRLATSVQAARSLGQTNQAMETTSTTKPGSRRRSSTNVMLSSRIDVIQDLGRDMQDQASGLPTTVWQQAHHEQRQNKLQQRKSVLNMNMTSNPSSIAPSENTTPTGAAAGRRRSMGMQESVAQDSRSAFERRYQARMADAMINSSTCPEPEPAAPSAKAFALGAFTASKTEPRSAQEAKAEAGIAKLEKQREVDKNAEMLGMSDNMKAALTRKAALVEPDEEEQEFQKALEEEEDRVQDDIQRLAAAFQATQETHLNRMKRAGNLPPTNRRRSVIPMEALAGKELAAQPPEQMGPEPQQGPVMTKRPSLRQMKSGKLDAAMRRSLSGISAKKSITQ